MEYLCISYITKLGGDMRELDEAEGLRDEVCESKDGYDEYNSKNKYFNDDFETNIPKSSTGLQGSN